MKETETKSDKFNRLVNKRYSNISYSLDVLSKLGNKRLFSYTEDQKKELLDKIDRDVAELKTKFQ